MNAPAMKLPELSPEAIVSPDMMKEVKAFLNLQAKKKGKEAELDIIKEELRIQEEKLILMYEQSGVDAIVIMGKRVSPTERLFVSAKAAEREEAMAWLRANDLGELIQENVHGRTLSAAIKEVLENGGDMPPEELFNIHIKQTMVARKA